MSKIELLSGKNLIVALSATTPSAVSEPPSGGMSVLSIIMIALVILLVAALLTIILLPRREEPIRIDRSSRRKRQRSPVETYDSVPHRTHEPEREEREACTPMAKPEGPADPILSLIAEIEALKMQMNELAADIKSFEREQQQLKTEIRNMPTPTTVIVPPTAVATPVAPEADILSQIPSVFAPVLDRENVGDLDMRLIEDYNNALTGSAKDRDAFKSRYDYILFGIPESAIFLRGLNENASEDYSYFQETTDGKFFGVKVTRNGVLHLCVIPVFNTFNTGDESFKKDYGFFQLFEAPIGVSEYRLVKPAIFTVTGGRINCEEVERGVMARW